MNNIQWNRINEMGLDYPLNPNAVSDFDKYLVCVVPLNSGGKARVVQSNSCLGSAKHAARIMQEHADKHGHHVEYIVRDMRGEGE